MPQTLPFSGAIMYDIFNADGLPKIGSALDDEMGTKAGSNVRIFDGLLQSQNNQIVSLQSQLTQLIQDNYTIYYVELTKDTTVTTFSSYTGNNNKFTELKEDYIYLLKFDSNNVGNVQININALGFVNAFKVDTGIPIVFQDDDIATSVPYLFLYKGGQFIFVGENDVQKLKELDSDIATLQDSITTIDSNLTSEITARDPQNKRVDAFLASNHDMAGFSVPGTYTPVTGSDTSLSAFEKIAAQQNQQDAEITTLEQRVDSLYGAVIYLGTVEEHTTDITQTILTTQAQSILTDREISTDLKQGYTLVDLDLNDWWYDEIDSLWINIGYSTVSLATNITSGVVMGSTIEGKISIEADGTMIANGVLQSSDITQSTGTSTTFLMSQAASTNAFVAKNSPTAWIQLISGLTWSTGTATITGGSDYSTFLFVTNNGIAIGARYGNGIQASNSNIASTGGYINCGAISISVNGDVWTINNSAYIRISPSSLPSSPVNVEIGAVYGLST